MVRPRRAGLCHDDRLTTNHCHSPRRAVDDAADDGADWHSFDLQRGEERRQPLRRDGHQQAAGGLRIEQYLSALRADCFVKVEAGREDGLIIARAAGRDASTSALLSRGKYW